MNSERVEGKFDQVAGKIKQGVGEMVGNDKLANSGVADQVKGSAKETWGNVKDTAAVVHDDTRAKANVQGETTAHNMREKVAETAHNMKDNLNEKLDDIKREHRS